MPLSKLTPAELVEELRALARVSEMDTFSDIPESETVEADAADFVESAVRFLEQIAETDGPLASRARAILTRLE